MVHLFRAVLTFGAVAAVSAEHSYFINGQYDQEGQMRDATCDNNCFFQFFTNKCNSDNPACHCTLHDMRANYYCCMAKNCLPYVVTDAMGRLSNDCIAWKMPVPAFDVEAVCGIKIVAESTSQDPTAESTSHVATSTVSTSMAISSHSGSESTRTATSSTTPASSATPASTTVTTTALSANSTTATGGKATTTTAKQGMGLRVSAMDKYALLALSAVFGAIL